MGKSTKNKATQVSGTAAPAPTSAGAAPTTAPAPETTGAAPTTAPAPETTGAAPTTAPAPETTGAAPTTAPEPEMFDMFIPLLPGKHQPDFQGSINGVPFQLPRGQVAKLPRPVYEVVKNTMKNENDANQRYYKAQVDLMTRAKEEEDRILGK